MLETPLTMRALEIAEHAHAGQVDKGGTPYIEHPKHVAACMHTEMETCAALLHDVVEDTSVTLDDLRGAGMPDAVVDAVALLTHDDDTPYLDYVRALKTEPHCPRGEACRPGAQQRPLA